MKNAITVLLIATMSFVSCSGGGASNSAVPSISSQIQIVRLAHNNSTQPEDVYHYFASRFKELFEEATNNRYDVQIFAKSYGDEREMFEACTLGTADMVVSTNAQIGSFKPTAFAIDLPFIFPDETAAAKALTSQAAQNILDSFADIGIKGLAFGMNGFRQVVTNNRNITSLEDCVGMKIRCMENEMYVKSYKALGINAVPMAFAEVISGIQQHLLDGLDLPYSTISMQSFEKITPYSSKLNCFFNASTMAANMTFFEKLPNADQETMEKTAKEAAQREIAYFMEADNNFEKDLTNRGLKIAGPSDLVPFRTAVKSVYAEYEKMIGGNFVQDLISAAQK
jgi:TRAP-type C4-dicarboxylate transport system substrate-binding protein